MSRFDYEQSKQLAMTDPSFAALIMAAIRRADTGNYRHLCGAFPEIAGELQARYNAPGGYIPGDPDVPAEIERVWDAVKPEPDEAWTECPDCGRLHDVESCRKDAADCDCCRSIAKDGTEQS